MRDLRARDPRFPAKTAGGYPALAVAALLVLRDLEGMTDQEYAAAERAEAVELLERLDAGEVGFLKDAERQRFRDAVAERARGDADRHAAVAEAASVLHRYSAGA
jgi:hypothetical protein